MRWPIYPINSAGILLVGWVNFNFYVILSFCFYSEEGTSESQESMREDLSQPSTSGKKCSYVHLLGHWIRNANLQVKT